MPYGNPSAPLAPASPAFAIVPSAGGALQSAGTPPSIALPIGTLMTYAANVEFSSDDLYGKQPRDFIAAVGQTLSNQWGIAVVNSAPPSFNTVLPGATSKFSLSLQLNRGFASVSEVQSIVDGVVNGTFGALLLNSNAIVTGSVVPGAATQGLPPGSAAPAPSFLKKFWPWLALGGAGLIIFGKNLGAGHD